MEKKCEGMGIPVCDQNLYTLSFAGNQVVVAQDKEKIELHGQASERRVWNKLRKNGIFNKKDFEIFNKKIKARDKCKYAGFIIPKDGTTEEK